MSFNDAWRNAKVNDGESNITPPGEGEYEVLLTSAGAFVSKAGNEVVKLELRVLQGEHEHYEWVEFGSFGSEGAANAAKTMCARLGVPVDEVGSLEQLDAELKVLASGRYTVAVERKGEYLNTYVQVRLFDEQPPPVAEAGAVMADNGVPF